MKKILSFLILALILVFSCTIASAAQEGTALYSYYSDNMLFKQNDEAVIAGTAEAGAKITCTLYNSASEQVAYAETTALADGTFSLSFMAPEGSFEEYSIRLTSNGEIFREIKGVVFGELWLAGGQSNMHLELKYSLTGSQMFAEGKTGSSALRYLAVSHTPTYKGDINKAPALPFTDYEENYSWYKGNEAAVYDLSGVGYFFAEKLIQELNVPVGILNTNLGGSSILTWLSREAIENNSELLADCVNNNAYIPLDKWNESSVHFALDMTSNFNKIIAPLKNFRLSGMIWYQGESDISWQYGRYSRAFDALQKSYTEYFSYKDDLLPIVFTQLASYSYGNLSLLPGMNAEFLDIQQQQPESRALISIYDIPLDYTISTHAIHPLRKQEVGEKMAHSAAGLVYGLNNSYTATGPEKVEIKDSSIYITLHNVGDGLMVLGDKISGFSICGSDGIYLSAKAELISNDTVRVYNSQILAPVSAAYAFTQTNYNATLYASENGQKTLPVSPFVTNRAVGTHYWNNEFWASCDYEYFWHCHTNEFSGGYNTWNTSGATVTFGASEIDTGNALYITSVADKFSVSPNFIYKEYDKESRFQDIDRVWSDYDAITFKVKVNSESPVRFEGLKIQANNTIWVMPEVVGTNDVGVTIEADGNVHTITLDLNKLHPYGDKNTTTFEADILNAIMDAEFIFSGTGSDSAKISFDEVSFQTGITSSGTSQPDEPQKISLLDRIKAFFISLFAKITLFFDKLF